MFCPYRSLVDPDHHARSFTRYGRYSLRDFDLQSAISKRRSGARCDDRVPSAKAVSLFEIRSVGLYSPTREILLERCTAPWLLNASTLMIGGTREVESSSSAGRHGFGKGSVGLMSRSSRPTSSRTRRSSGRLTFVFLVFLMYTRRSAIIFVESMLLDVLSFC